MARNAAPPPETGTETDQETSRITTIADLKTEQDRQGGLIDELLTLVKGGQREEGKAHDAAQAHVENKLADPGHLGEIRQAIRDVNAETAAAEQASAHEREHERLRHGQEPAEQQPRDAMVKGKARLQKMLFGADR